MGDYISREAAKRILSTLLVKDAAECACNLIDSIFPADVEPVVHGRKIEDGDIGVFYLCSLCGECLPYGANYCPSCGAKMCLEDETNDD